MTTIKDKTVSDLIRVIELAEVALSNLHSNGCKQGWNDNYELDMIKAQQAISEIRKLKGE